MAENNKLTAAQMYAAVGGRVELSAAKVRAIFDELRDIAATEIVSSGEFTIPGIAKFEQREQAARTARNPTTGEPIAVPAKTVVKAKVAAALKNAVAAG